MQQPPTSEAPINPPNITTELIQKCLEENKQLILVILEFNSLGKHAEIAPYQARLQSNLTFLAGIADAQPQDQATSSQISPQTAALQQELQAQLQGQPLATVLAQPLQQHSPNMAFQISDHPFQQQQQQLQLPYHQQQQLNHTEMGMRPGSSSTGNVLQAMQTGLGNPFMSMAGNRQGSLGAADGHGKSVYEHMDGDAQNMRLM